MQTVQRYIYIMVSVSENHTNSIRELTYTVFPMREQPFKAMLFWPVTILTLWAVYWNSGSWLLTFIGAAVLFGSLTSYYLPTHYSVDNKGVRMQRLYYGRHLSWERIRSIVDERDGIFLSPFPVKTRLENFRGLYMPYRDNRIELLSLIRKYAPDVKGLSDE